MFTEFRRARFAAAIVALAFFRLSPASASIVYAIHDDDLGTFVDGTITTDGKLGSLALSDIVGWSLSLSGSSVVPITLTPANSTASFQGTDGALTATSQGLFWNYSSDGVLEFLLQQGSFSAFVLYQSPFVAGEKFFLGCCVDPGGVERSGVEALASVTPISSTLPLFAGGVATIGLLGWHRKRRLQARRLAPEQTAASR